MDHPQFGETNLSSAAIAKIKKAFFVSKVENK